MAGGQVYRLQALLEVRQREEDGKKVELGDAVRATQLAREREVEAKQAVLDAGAIRQQAQAKRAARLDSGPVLAADMTMAQQFDRRLVAAIEQATEKATAAEQLVRDAQLIEDQARVALGDAAKERMAIEKHKEKWAAERKREREQHAEAEADDLANRIKR